MLRSLAIICLMLLAFSSCFLRRSTRAKKDDTAAAAVQKKERARKPSLFRYGNTRDQVLAGITDRSELIVAELNMPQGHMAVYQYNRYGKARYKDPGYYLYFMNDTLIRKSAPEDPEKGAKAAVKQYYERDRE